MILTITLNPCIDKSSTINTLVPESKLRCTELINEPGGGGINVSKALSRLNAETVALFPAGGYNGNMLCGLLDKEGIRYHAIDTKVETRENWIVHETDINHQYRFTFPGREIDPATIKLLADQVRNFSAPWVVASGSLPPGVPDSFYALVVEKVNAAGAKCIVDTNGPALAALKGKKAFLIKPNISELARLMDVPFLSPSEVGDAARQLITDNYAELVAVSMGPEGAWLVSKNETHFAVAPPVEKMSTVGAGDSMVAGMAFMLCNHKPLKEIIEFGVACGSAATMNEGTQLFKKEDVDRLYGMMAGS